MTGAFPLVREAFLGCAHTLALFVPSFPKHYLSSPHRAYDARGDGIGLHFMWKITALTTTAETHPQCHLNVIAMNENWQISGTVGIDDIRSTNKNC